MYRRREYKLLKNLLISTVYEQHPMLKHKRCEFDTKGKSVWQQEYLSVAQRALNACGIKRQSDRISYMHTDLFSVF
jgi:hypothetical protein